MKSIRHRGSALLALLMTTACGSSPTAPSAQLPPGHQAFDVTAARAFKGDCRTTVAPIDPPVGAGCRVFEPTPSVFIEIAGECQVTHLGRSTTHAVQQLVFALDADGRPVFDGGQPVIAGLRNCAEFTSADGEVLRHVTSGTVAPGVDPGTVTFEGRLIFTGGTGRFATASGSAAFDGAASLITNTGQFSMKGTLEY